jgi:hypothetical protein
MLIEERVVMTGRVSILDISVHLLRDRIILVNIIKKELGLRQGI